jgi:hypothetical protein
MIEKDLFGFIVLFEGLIFFIDLEVDISELIVFISYR